VNSRSSFFNQGEVKVKKALLILDFVCSHRGVPVEEDDKLVTRKGIMFKLQGKVKTPEVTDVTIPQWLSANVRILEQLVSTFTTSQLFDYLTYTHQIRDLLQV
jgi:hypothetical protein